MKVHWTLRYHPDVTSYLYALRESPTATEIRRAIMTLKQKEDPTEGCVLAQGWEDRYEFEVAGHWVGFEVVIIDKALRVLYVVTVS